MSRSFTCFDVSRAVLDKIGWTSNDPDGDVDLDLDQPEHPLVVFKALYGQLQSEEYRLEEAALRGVKPDPDSSVEAEQLRDLVASVREQAMRSRHACAAELPLEAGATRRRKGRWPVLDRSRRPRRGPTD
jgi:hypothetical protein